MTKPGRLYYLDAMRSILMLLGVVLHSASIYRTSASWAIHDPVNSEFFDWFVYSIHLFRMPAFFIVSGFFCHMTLTRYGTSHFLRVRLQRIIIPTVTVALLLNTVQTYILKNYRNESDFIATLASSNYWFEGGWVSHLWFLNNLVVYFIVAGIIYALAGQQLSKLMDYIRSNKLISFGGLYILALPLITYGSDFIAYNINFTCRGPLCFLSLSELMHFSSFFIFGFFLGAHDHLIEDFSKLRAWLIPVFIASLYLLVNVVDANSGVLQKIITRYLEALLPWIACVGCFFIFKTYFNQHSKLFFYLSDAAYSVYLFHHLIVISLGLLLIPVDINIFLKFVMVTSGTAIITIAIHHFGVLRFSFLRYIFNGKYLGKNR